MRFVRFAPIWVTVVLAAMSIAVSASAQQGDADASGEIAPIKPSGYEIKVEGYTKNGSLWLGCTFYPDTENERDLKAIQVRGKFSESFTVPTKSKYGSSVKEFAEALNEAECAVALWRWKINKSDCTKGTDGRPCIYCVQNGYHLEDRVDAVTYTYSFLGKEADRTELVHNQEIRARRESEERDQREVSKPFSQRLGVKVVDFEVLGEEVVCVIDVTPGSKADEAGIKRGYCIYGLAEKENGRRVVRSGRPANSREFDDFHPSVGSTVDIKVYLPRTSESGRTRYLEGETTVSF